jgi:hypothetical protein
MIAPTERFIEMGKKVPHGELGKEMPTKEVINTMVVWLDTSSNDEHTSYDLLERCRIEATIKGKMLENALNDIVDNDEVEVPYLLPTIWEGIMDSRGRVVDPPWMRPCKI